MRILLPITACLIYLLYGCSAPANIRATTLVRAANDYITDCEDSFINKLDSENDMIIVAAAVSFPDVILTYHIVVCKTGVWKGYYYRQASVYNLVSVIDSFAITGSEGCIDILSFVLKNRVFELPGGDGLPPCTKATILDGALLSLYIGIPGKIIGRQFGNPDYYNKYCPAPNRTAFIEAWQKVAGLFPKKAH